eukprot:TRINITY_DN9742_c0_g1_i4.p1 TRINITY_DN9742_c0_g1~~TRINITY_DN9742_c0_g1_i4.p1  ORF type:complete len:207 (-),score=48.66 TRINITY_DN9742_c0_g1_i4:8-586(-)
MNEQERAEAVGHCKWVDKVVLGSPWVLTPEFVEEHQIDYVVHGEDLCLDENGKDVYSWLKEAGKFKTIKRTEGISTSDLILRIIKDYDDFIRRNLNRGYTREQLGVSYVKEKSLKAENTLKKVKETMEERFHDISEYIKKYGPWEGLKIAITTPFAHQEGHPVNTHPPEEHHQVHSDHTDGKDLTHDKKIAD